HCSTRLTYIVRQAPFATAHLSDQDLSVDFSRLTTPADRVVVIATAPLTDNEVWHPIPPGTLLAFRHGAIDSLGEATTIAGNPAAGAGSV
ncbi:class II glutamine amidotransferase, partial [Aromatoleum toluclasticum]|uniref:class II glutamine amidotransferase n=1 Tax=Aromatoleum toluclasticum TaxID=92003 RepID=UPI001D197F3B